MALYVNTNVSALRGKTYLDNVNNALNTTYTRLSSGLRINSAKDDAAGLQISDRLTTQINGLTQANRNANDAIAFAQTVEGGLDEITNMLQRMRTLAVQASNGINTAEDRKAISDEVGQLTMEINRIAEQTTYGGKQILAGRDTNTIYSGTGTGNKENAGDITFQIGANSGDSLKISIKSFYFSYIASNAGLNDTSNGGSIADYGLVQVKTDTTSAVPPAENFVGGITKADAYAFQLSVAAMAEKAISGIDKMIAEVDKSRSELGAFQNRMESTIRVQSNVITNSSDARSRIRDTDFAEESANLSQQSIIQQAATSMLMQANARPQLGLSLLG